MMGKITDKELIKGCLKSDRRCQKLLFEKYAPKLMTVCLRYMQNREEAEDVLMDSFVKIFTKLPTFKYESLPEVWMKSITVNNAISFLRKNAKYKTNISIEEVEIDLVDDEVISVDSQFSEKEILEIINSMPEYLKIVINMRAFEGMEYNDIASILEINEVTCRTRFSKGKKWLEKKLNNNN